MAEQWLSIVEYARSFSISDMTVRRRIKTGKLHAILKEGKYFIPVDSARVSARPSRPAASVSDLPSVSPTSSDAGSMPTENSPSNSELYHLRSRDAAAPAVASRAIFAPSSKRIEAVADARLFDSTMDRLIVSVEQAVRHLKESEVRHEDVYKERIRRLEAELRVREAKIRELGQQVEDMQILTRMLEGKDQSQKRHPSP